MAQRIPDKPAFLASDEWSFILKRDGYQCALAPICARRGLTDYCDDVLDVDHDHPRELGGDDTFGNVRLLCASTNRGRKVEPAKRWAEPNFWDEENVRVGKLRQIQQLAGWNAIDDLAKQQPSNLIELRKRLLGSTTLLVGATGIGKTLLFQSIAFRINRLIGVGFPRVKHVLWLVTDNTLRELRRKELETEAYDLLVIPRKPVVQVADSYDTLNKGPQGADIVITTAHVLWKVEQSDGTLRRSDDQIRVLLSSFDTIVFDEGDWANEEVRHIATLAKHAWQFALTASPRIPSIVGEKESEAFLNRFVLIAPEAVADYERAVRLDSCLKLLSLPLIRAGHDGRDQFERGLRNTVGQQVREDLLLSCSLIVEAIIEADHLETRMKEKSPDQYYSPHVMARLDTIADIRLAAPIIQERLNELKAAGLLINPGWNVAMLFQGAKLPAGERDLSAKDRQGRWRHPFMAAKNTNGQATEACSRVLLMCNIGVRGINNWPIQTIVDCSRRMSPTDIIQFVFGRPIRWPNHLASWLDKRSGMNEFATLKIMLPPTDYADNKSDEIAVVRNFIDNMLDEIRSVGFLTWADLLSGISTSDAEINIDHSPRMLAQSEKYQVQEMLAAHVDATGSLNEVPLDQLIDRQFPNVMNSMRARLRQYGERLSNRVFRDDELMAAQVFESIRKAPECVIDKLLPQQKYDTDTLKRWVRSDPLFQQTWPECISRLENNDQLTVDMVGNTLRFIQQNNYRSPARLYDLNGPTREEPGVLDELANELATDLYKANQAPQDKGAVPKAIRSAAMTLFDIDTARNGGPMDQPAYHIAMLGKYRRTIQAMARAMLIKDGTWPLLKRLSDQQ